MFVSPAWYHLLTAMTPSPLPPGQDPAFTMGHHSFTATQEAALDVAAANQGMSGSEIRERFDLAVTRMREALVQADTKARLERGIDSALAHLSGSLLGADPDHVYVEESVSDCRAALLAALAKEGFPT